MASKAHTTPSSTSVSPFIAALIGPTIAADGPVRSNDLLMKTFDEARNAYQYAESKQTAAEALRYMAFMEGSSSEPTLRLATTLATNQLERAADRLINAAMPIDRRPQMISSVWCKRQAARRFRYNDSQAIWKAIIDEDEARIPPGKPRKPAAA